MFKLLNAESKTIFGAAAILGVLSFASRIVGLIRDRILAGMFWGGDTLDAYYAAFKVPDVLFSLIVIGSLSASFIPLFTKYYANRSSRDRAWQLTSNVLNLIAMAMALVSIVLFVFADPISTIIAPGYSGAKHDLVVHYTRIMLSAEMILSLSVVLGSALQGMRRFVLFACAPVLYNAGIIVGAVWLTKFMGPAGLAWGVVLGAVLHLAIQAIGVFLGGYRYRPVFRPFDRDTLDIFRLMGPRVLGIGVSQITFVLFTMIASTLAAGSLSIFQFAYNIEFVPIGIIAVSYAIAAFPTFSAAIERNDQKGFVVAFSSTIRQMLLFMIPLMLVFLLLRAQIVRVVVGTGNFDWEATILTADTLAFFALTFVPQALVFVLSRAFFALHDTVTPLAAGLISALLALITAFWLTPHFGVIGLAMAFSLSSIVNAILLWVPLRQRVGSLDEERILRSLFVMSTAGISCGIVIQLLKPFITTFLPLTTFWNVFSQGLLAGGAGLLVYVGICFILGSEELREIISGIRKRVFQKAQPEETIATTETSSTT